MRIDPLKPDDMDPAQRAVYERIVTGPRGGFRGPATVWLHRPVFTDHAQALGAYCRYHSSLSARLSELAILIVAAHWRSKYEWWAHAPLAHSAGVEEAVIEAIRSGESPPFTGQEDATVYEVVQALQRERAVPLEIYQQAERVLGIDRLVDLIGVVGYYTLVSMTLNCFDFVIPDNAEIRFGLP